MDRLNQAFQEVLEERQFRMKVVESEQQFSYHGRLALSQDYTVHFALLVPKSDEREVVQIVFDKILTVNAEEFRDEVLDILNYLNLTIGLYYYFALRENGDVFARYMLPVDPSRTEYLLELIQIGGRLMHQAREQLEDLYLARSSRDKS